MNEREIFTAALNSDPGERAAFLAQACGDNLAVRVRVEALLRDHDSLGSFLETPAAAGILSETAELFSACDQPGEILAGRYQLVEPIGEGGMGTVWLAEQTHPIRRRVAVKLIKPGMDTRHVIARFEAERQALAIMDHPNIARVFDAGTAQSGRPFFVMELVRGIPITDYCDQVRATTRQRLELFVSLCRAVQHAHTKGIIHRDVKPSNVLVTMHDGTPVPKVIDFGVAKAIDPPLADQSVHTRFAQLIGTPTYMSPEQVEWSNLDIDTRSDVYSLGVLLYELLTGATPFAGTSFKEVGFDELRRIIREVEPPRPSKRWSTLDVAARSTIAERRGVDVRQVSRLLRGELDWIVMKALEKDRTRRYESASAFADDVERYLNDVPVQARPAGIVRTIWKWCRRHRGPAGLILAIVVFLLSGFAGLAWHSSRLGTALLTSEHLREDLAQREHRLREEAYAADMSLVWHARQTGNLEHARTLLARHVPESGETDLRGFEWRYLSRRCQPEMLTYTGHSAGILCADISPDDRWIASGDIGGAVKIWDLETGEEVRSLRHSDKEVCAVRFHPHRPLLATAGQLDMVRLWNLEDGSAVTRVVGHDGTVCSLAWSPDGTRLASASRDGFIVVWDATTPSATKVIARLEHGDVVRCVAWSPDGKLVAGATTDAAGNGEVRLWETGRWQPAGKLVGHEGGIITLAFDPTGRFLASAGYSAHTILFDVAERRVLERHRHETSFRSIWSLTFIPGISGSRSDLVAGLSGDGLVWWTALGSAGELARLPTNINHAGRLRAIQPTRKADRLLTASQHDRTLKLWETGALRNYAIAARIPSRTLALDPSRDRSAGFAENDGALWLFAASQGKKLLRLGADSTRDPVRAAAFSPDGKSLATAQGTGRICVWNLKSGACRSLVTGPPLDPDIDIRLLFSPNGKVLAIGQAACGVRLLDVDTGDIQANFNIQESEGCALAFSPDGSVLAAPVAGESADSARIVCRRTDTGKPIAILTSEHSSVEALAFSKDGTLLAAGGTRGLVVYDWRNQRELVRFLPQNLTVQDVAFFPDGKTLVTTVHDGTLRLWSLAAKRELFTLLRSDALRQFTRGRLTILSATQNALTVLVSTDPNRPGEILIFEGARAQQ